MACSGVPLIVIQRQLDHTNLDITSIYLQGIDNAEIIDTVHVRRDADGSPVRTTRLPVEEPPHVAQSSSEQPEGLGQASPGRPPSWW
jgi:hypothetical protein